MTSPLNSWYDKVLTFAVPIALISIHLINFAVRKELQNLPGKNVASYCVTRIIMYSFQFVLNSSYGQRYCSAVQLPTFYVTLAGLGWCLVICYDVQRTLRESLNLAPDRSRQRRRNNDIYRRYVLFSTLLCLVVFVVEIAVILCFHKDVFKPGCLFDTNRNTDFYMVVPVAIIIVAMLLYYVSCLRLILGRNQRQPILWYEHRRRFFVFYSSLTFISVVNVVLGLLFLLYKLHELKWFYIISNWTLAVYILTVFTYRDKLKLVKRLVRKYWRRNADLIERNDLPEDRGVLFISSVVIRNSDVI